MCFINRIFNVQPCAFLKLNLYFIKQNLNLYKYNLYFIKYKFNFKDVEDDSGCMPMGGNRVSSLSAMTNPVVCSL